MRWPVRLSGLCEVGGIMAEIRLDAKDYSEAEGRYFAWSAQQAVLKSVELIWCVDFSGWTPE